MIRYSTESRDRILMKGYGILSFAENIVKNLSKNLNRGYSQNFLDHAKTFITETHKTTSKRVTQKNSRSNW